MTVKHTAIILSCCLSGAVLGAAPPVFDSLMRMQSALQTTNYHGTMVYLQGDQIQSMQVIHKVDENGEHERLFNLNGAAREVIRKKDVVTCYMPGSKMVTVGKRHSGGNLLSKLAENDFGNLQNNYYFEFEAEDRVAGLNTQRILIKPKDAFRYGYRLWVGNKNSLLLKSNLLDGSGDVLEQMMFADISIVDNIPAVMLEPVSSGEGFTWFEHESPENNAQMIDSHWQVNSMPDGFSVTARYRHRMPNSQEPAEHWVVSDGLASISIYIEKMPEQQSESQQAFEGVSHMGAVNAFGALVFTKREGAQQATTHQVTVIGEAPANTVEMIGRSVALQTTTNGLSAAQ